MPRLVLAVAAVAVLAAAPLALAQRRGADELTIRVQPDTITFGQSTEISGMLKGNDRRGKPVELQARPYGGSFGAVASTTTETSGRYSFTVKPAGNTRYRVVRQAAPAITSDEEEAIVRFRVTFRLSDYTPSRCERVRFSGSVLPAHDGRTVYIQKQTSSGRWRGVARTRLRDAGRSRSAYSRRIRTCRDGEFRVRVVRDADHATGDSRVLTANVP